jgi:hypothetical protein
MVAKPLDELKDKEREIEKGFFYYEITNGKELIIDNGILLDLHTHEKIEKVSIDIIEFNNPYYMYECVNIGGVFYFTDLVDKNEPFKEFIYRYSDLVFTMTKHINELIQIMPTELKYTRPSEEGKVFIGKPINGIYKKGSGGRNKIIC